mmetsp:Transcript_10234/g.20194  ORF Transcript_10234/g.20194 Transcript_10234/m.20194 type:complete len:223 (+) Transcript_10234:109-777(+)
MATSATNCELQCGYILKIFIILLASVGIACSFFASRNCQFLYFESEPFDGIDASVDGQTEGWIGIFKYGLVTKDNIEESTAEECSYYDKFLNMDSPNEALLASQLCGILAPCLAFIAICISTIELLCCRFSGGFVLASVLLLAASLFQSGTFGVFLIDQELCFDSDGCTIGKAAYISTSAIFSYFSACILLCCSPRPLPCMRNSHKKRCETVIDDELEAPEQ